MFLKTFKILYLYVKIFLLVKKKKTTTQLLVNFSSLLSHSFKFFNIYTLKTEVSCSSLCRGKATSEGSSIAQALHLCCRKNSSLKCNLPHFLWKWILLINNIQWSIWIWHLNNKSNTKSDCLEFVWTAMPFPRTEESSRGCLWSMFYKPTILIEMRVLIFCHLTLNLLLISFFP